MTRIKAYLVEDSPVIAENLIATLDELADVDVVGCSATETEAINWLRNGNEDWQLAIVDLFLSEGSGLRVLDACRPLPTHRRMVVFSNFATADVRRRCAELGADAVFDKSTEVDGLIDYCVRLSAE